jgi:protein phosphatase
MTRLGVGRAAGLSDTGRRRRRNEDAYVLRPPLFAVADGMGGAQAGEVASRLAAAALTDEPEERPRGPEAVARLVRSANRRVYERSSEDAAVSGMGTTMTVALVEDGSVTIGHVGDSRAYLVRAGRLEQLTQDHSLVAELVRSGKLTPAEAGAHPQRSVITRALGTDPEVDVDTLRVETRAGDLFLLCSDGLTSMVGDDEILATLEANRHDLDSAARALVALANRGGGEDNITVVFFEIGDADGRFDEEDTLTGIPAPVESARAEADDASDPDLSRLRDGAVSGSDEEPALTALGLPAVGAPEAPTDTAASQRRDATETDASAAPRPRRSRVPRPLAVVAAVALLLGLLALLLWGLSS